MGRAAHHPFHLRALSEAPRVKMLAKVVRVPHYASAFDESRRSLVIMCGSCTLRVTDGRPSKNHASNETSWPPRNPTSSSFRAMTLARGTSASTAAARWVSAPRTLTRWPLRESPSPDYYGQQSCTAGRAAFITGQNPVRTGLTKVGTPRAVIGLQPEDPTIAELLKPLGYRTGQFGKNHLGDRDKFLPTMHGFDEFFGNLHHLKAQEEPELEDFPKDPAFQERFGPRGCCTRGPMARAARKLRVPVR